MKFGIIMCIVLMSTMCQMTCGMKSRYQNEQDYYDFEPQLEDEIGLNNIQKLNNFRYPGFPRSDVESLTETPNQVPETTCITLEQIPEEEVDTTPRVEEVPKPMLNTPATSISNSIHDAKSKELQHLVQLLYIAQARVQLEASEIKKAQAIANSAQKSLEEATNHVRVITGALQNAQNEVANAAIRAQTAQLQLAAHDQLLFAARQDVDGLSSQMVSLQAAEGISEPEITVDLTNLLEKLKQPLQEHEKPTPVSSIVPIPAYSKQSKLPYQQQRHPNPYYK